MAGYKGIYLFYVIKKMENVATLKTFLLNGKLESLLGYGLNPPTRISSVKIPPRIFPKPFFKNGGIDNATHQSTIIHRPSEDNSGVQNGGSDTVTHQSTNILTPKKERGRKDEEATKSRVKHRQDEIAGGQSFFDAFIKQDKEDEQPSKSESNIAEEDEPLSESASNIAVEDDQPSESESNIAEEDEQPSESESNIAEEDEQPSEEDEPLSESESNIAEEDDQPFYTDAEDSP